MKTLIAFSLLLSLFCHAKVSEPSSTIDGDVAKIARAEVDDRPNWLKIMSNNICTSINHGNDIVATVDRIIISNLVEEDGIADPTPDQVANFWNRYVAYMTCEIDGEEIHVMKHSLDQNLAFYFLFKHYLDHKIQRKLVDKSVRLNMNFIIDGQTVLDVVDEMLGLFETFKERFGDGSYNDKTSKIKRIRKHLVRRFDAKHAHEITDEYVTMSYLVPKTEAGLAKQISDELILNDDYSAKYGYHTLRSDNKLKRLILAYLKYAKKITNPSTNDYLYVANKVLLSADYGQKTILQSSLTNPNSITRTYIRFFDQFLFSEFMAVESKSRLNFNVVTKGYDGVPKTLLDTINDEIARGIEFTTKYSYCLDSDVIARECYDTEVYHEGGIDRMVRLKAKLMSEYGAKTYAELKTENQ